MNVRESVAVSRKCSLKKVFLKILQNLQENIFAIASFLIKLQAEAYNFIKKGTQAQENTGDCFYVLHSLVKSTLREKPLEYDFL